MRSRSTRLAARTELGPDPEPLGVRFDEIVARLEARPAPRREQTSTEPARREGPPVQTYAPAGQVNGRARSIAA